MATGEIPESVYRNTLDLDRFSTGVAKKLIRSYDRIIKEAIIELARIEQMKKADQPKYKADRLRSLLKQLQASLRSWSDKSADQMVRDLDGIARLQSEFAQLQLEKALPTGVGSVVKPLNITREYADSVVNSKPIDLNASLLSDDLQAKVKGIPEKFSLTAKKGALVNLPNGEPLLKNFRALAQKQATMFGQTVRDGMLTGETTPQIARRLRSQLLFEDGKLMKNNQVSTLVRTSVHQVSNDAAQSVYEANQDITSKYKWIATLDSRTAPQCRVLDQQVFKYGQGPEPPQHFNCRCRTVAEIDYERLGVRPPSKPLGERSAVGGSVPAGTTYGKYLSKQSASYKAKALGKTKVKYFNVLSKKYGPDSALKKMIRNDGQSKTLKQLQKAYGKQPSKKLTTAVKASPKPKLKPTKKEAAILAAEKQKKVQVQSLKKQLDSLAKDSPSKELTTLKRTVDRIAGPELATSSQLSAKTQEYLMNFQQLDLKNPKHSKWFETQIAFNSDVIPKGQLKTITPAQLFRRVQDKEVGLLQKKYDKAYKKSLLPKKEAVKRASLKKWDDKSYLDKNLVGSSNVSAVRKQSTAGRKTTSDLLEKPKEKNLGLTKAQLKDTENIIGEWCGDAYVELRGSQLQQAQAVGAQLNPQQVKHLKRYKNIRARSASAQNSWARQVDKVEEFISKSPKWKGKPDGLLKGQIEKDGTIFRGMALNDPKVVESIIESYKNGDAGLTMESWTMSRTKAGNFALGEIGHGNHQVILKQVNKYGTSIENYNGQGEREILQPRGVRYRVLKSTTDKWTERGDAHSMTEIFLEAY